MSTRVKWPVENRRGGRRAYSQMKAPIPPRTWMPVEPGHQEVDREEDLGVGGLDLDGLSPPQTPRQVGQTPPDPRRPGRSLRAVRVAGSGASTGVSSTTVVSVSAREWSSPTSTSWRTVTSSSTPSTAPVSKSSSVIRTGSPPRDRRGGSYCRAHSRPVLPLAVVLDGLDAHESRMRRAASTPASA